MRRVERSRRSQGPRGCRIQAAAVVVWAALAAAVLVGWGCSHDPGPIAVASEAYCQKMCECQDATSLDCNEYVPMCQGMLEDNISETFRTHQAGEECQDAYLDAMYFRIQRGCGFDPVPTGVQRAEEVCGFDFDLPPL